MVSSSQLEFHYYNICTLSNQVFAKRIIDVTLFPCVVFGFQWQLKRFLAFATSFVAFFFCFVKVYYKVQSLCIQIGH